MAIEIKFICTRSQKDYLKIDSAPKHVVIEGMHNGMPVSFYMDIPTSIKFAKTLRTEINKIKEVSNV